MLYVPFRVGVGSIGLVKGQWSRVWIACHAVITLNALNRFRWRSTESALLARRRKSTVLDLPRSPAAPVWASCRLPRVGTVHLHAGSRWHPSPAVQRMR